MTAAHQESQKPKAVYTDIEGMDIGPGIEMLRAADHLLSGAPRLTVTPPIGYQSRQTELEYVRVQAQEAVNFLLHGAPDHPVNAPAPAPHHLSRKARP